MPGILAFRVESSLMYFNVDHVLREMLHHLESRPEPVRLVVIDLSTSPYVDLAGARMLTKLCTAVTALSITARAWASRSPILKIETLGK